MTYKIFSEEKLSQAGQKNNNKKNKQTNKQPTKQKKKQANKKTKQSIGKKSFYSNKSYGLEHEKTISVNYLLKCS